jgi:hypothetical protein
VPITLTTSSAFHEYFNLIVIGYLTKFFAGFGIDCNCTKGHFNCNILAIGSCAPTSASRFAMASKYMSLVFKVDQCPQLIVSLKVNMTTSPAISSVGTTFGLELFAPKMCTAWPSFT